MSAPEFDLRFSFTANNATPDDKSGVARWEIPVERGGITETDTLVVKFVGFREALAVNQAMAKIWLAAEAEGFHRCKCDVLAALK